MSHTPSKAWASLPEMGGGHSALPTASPAPPHVQMADLALDAALCRVPLPDGLLTRLEAALHRTSDRTRDGAG